MPSLAELLERESQRVDLEHGHFERLIRRRERRQRNRKVGAGVLALALIVLGTAVFLRAIQPKRTPTDRSDQPPPAALGALAYAADGDIYVADWDGSNAVRIVDGRPAKECRGLGEYWGEGPMWSPNGRYLAFRQVDCEGPEDAWWDVVITDVEGDVVASFPSEGWLISWSPDSTRVASWVRWGETIGVYGLDGVRQTALTVPSGMMPSGDLDPVWSADGTSLLIPGGVVVPLDGSEPYRLPSDDPASHWGAAYSPDGSRVAYIDDDSVVVATSVGPASLQANLGWGVFPVWSPTGEQIAFSGRSGRSFPNEIRLMDVATGAVTSVTAKGGSDGLWVIDFSPDGDRILFLGVEDGGRDEASLWSIRVDGSGLRRLVSGTVQGDWQTVSQTN
jgi:Tol biopolymer transport system component